MLERRRGGKQRSEPIWKVTDTLNGFGLMPVGNTAIKVPGRLGCRTVQSQERSQSTALIIPLMKGGTAVCASRPQYRFHIKLLLAAWIGSALMVRPVPGQGQSLASVNPAPGSIVSNLSLITVTFTQPVVGVRAEDLMLNGSCATNVSGSEAVYTFGFSLPGSGAVEASWNGGHNITDLSGGRLDELGANTVWDYTLLDTFAPEVTTINPVPGATLTHLSQLAVVFSEPVTGVEASDLLVNGQAATQVTREGTGPYIFAFPAPAAGTVEVSWAMNHGLQDSAVPPNAFGGGHWSYTLRPGEISGNVVINEFVAANVRTNGLRDEDGDLADWIELYNRGETAVNLGGWSLTDDPEQPDMWVFPPATLGPGQYLVVFASGKDRRPTDGANLHTNFRLSRSGEYLGLFNANFSREVATQFLPAYPEQRPDITYGLYNEAFGYLTNPTPRLENSGPAAFGGLAADPQASVPSGLFKNPFSLTLSTPTPGASIRYTLNGSEPTPTSGILYSSPIGVTGSASQAVVNVRAVAFRGDLLCSRVITRSYIFPDYVLLQPSNPTGFPAFWTTQTNSGGNATVVPGDYQMDPRIITNTAYAALAAQALTNLPTLSIVAPIEDLFSQNRGLYANPNPVAADSLSWERTASAELILPDGSPGFCLSAGLGIHGSTSRDPNWTRKHSLRLKFKRDYDGKLEYPMFGDSRVEAFNTLVLSAGLNLSWNNRFEAAGARAQFVRDQFCSDLQLEMNHLASHGRFVHLYLNGLYWGLYNAHERPDDNFVASYLGGDDSQYDVVKNGKGSLEVVAGDTNAWGAMMALVNSGLSANGQYEQLRQHLDLDGFIDYMIVNHYAGNTDWANHNWYAYRQRAAGARFRFVSWDAEITLKGLADNVTGLNQRGTPTEIHSYLRNNAEYRLRFSDRVQRHFGPGGPLYVDSNSPAVDPAHPERNRPGALYLNRIREVESAVVLESARWGDSVPARTNNPFSRADFLTELNWLTSTYFPQRSSNVLNQYRTQLLYPSALGVAAPIFNAPSGNVSWGFNLTMSAPSGTIYYTTNGADPRVYGTGIVSPVAQAYSGTALTLNDTMLVRARAYNGATWSPLTEGTFAVAQPLLPLRITEIMYKPSGGDTYQYLELQNFGSTTLDLTGCAVGGISFTFPTGFTIAPGAVIVLANGLNPAAFAARYPGVTVAAYFSGNLAKKGERVTIKDALDRAVFAVNYATTNGWPVVTDGRSIELNDPAGDPNDPANWRLSATVSGTPGTIAAVPAPGPVLINEVMALNVSALINGGTYPDWVELVNTSADSVNLGGWSISDDGYSGKFIFPEGATLAPGGFLVVFCDTQTNAPGLHTGFALSGQGECVFLFDPQANRADAFSFGPQVSDLSVGRVGGHWQLTVPTPGAGNQLAAVSEADALVINEWLANAAAGQSDWLELYNPSSQPVALRGLYLGTSEALFQITAASYLPAGGYVQLLADELPGPDHLNFKLPAEGSTIALYDAFGAELDRATYGPQLDGISQGRLPDGNGNIVSFPGSASPGTTNFVVSFTGPRFNELMARNDSAVVNSWGEASDWVELYNPGPGTFDLSGMSLSLDQLEPGQWVFPAGTSLAAGGYLVLWCDGSRAASTASSADLNTGHSLDSNSGGAYLFNRTGQVVDYVEYGCQIRDQSIGCAGQGWGLLANPTPGAANSEVAALGVVANVRFNEWEAQPSSGDDWFELYNLDARPVDLGGLYLTDDPSLAGVTQFAIAPLSFIAGHGWAVWKADGHPGNGRNHVNFKLDGWGESLRLYSSDQVLLDAVDFGVQQAGVSEGRLPDGGGAIVAFPATPTPEQGNFLPLTGVVINEVLTHTDPPLEDAIELANLTADPVNIGGWYLSDSQNQLLKFRIPDETVIPAGGFMVFYQCQFDPEPGVFPSFALDSAHGEGVYLSATDAGGNLTGYRTGVEFGAAENGVSVGRYTNSTGVEFVALSQRTLGMDSPATLAHFRAGTGLPNAYPQVGPVVINELMYQPVTVGISNLTENPNEEFIELYNLSTNSVALFDPNNPGHTWKLRGGIAFAFPMGTVLEAQSHLLVVGFDPMADPAALAAFRARYDVDVATTVVGPFQGPLSNAGGSIELYKPDAPSPAPEAGFVPWILADRVNYGITAPWPAAAAGGGASLQRRVASAFGNDALNWMADPPTAGRTDAPQGRPAPPVITAQPQDSTVLAGTTISLSVTAQGSLPMTYRWQRDGVDLPGATDSCLTFSNAQPADSGHYQAWVSNTIGSICSRIAALSVLAPPVITVQPYGLSVNLGATVTLSVAASGSTPMQFQWYFNGEPLPGATNSSLTLSGVDPSQSGTYEAEASNPAGVAASQPATLTVAGLDSDGDGIPDSWMIQHFGHATALPSDHSLPQDDADSDRQSNLEEYLAETNPLDPQCCLKLKSQRLHAGSGQPEFSFTAMAGVGYTLQFCDDLGSDLWHKLNDVPADPTTRIVQVNDPHGALEPSRFYRVVTPMQP